MKVFISYRRNDSQDITGRIADRLRALDALEEVFVDVNDIPAGVVFTQFTDSEIAASDVCLVIIGSSWVGPNAGATQSRIFEKTDFVRREVVSALDAACKVIPILVNGARPCPPILKFPMICID